MKDELSTRMKEFYENRTRISLPRRTYTLIRIDGKAFHTYTRGLKRPFDKGLIEDMDETACYLCKNIQGAKFGFVQSDEISILVTDFEAITTDAWFDGNIQKIVSISSSMATSKFNQLRMLRVLSTYEDARNFAHDFANQSTIKVNPFKLAEFDARTFTIPSKTEVINYFIWRQIDTVRNSISSAAQSVFSHKELNNKNTDQMQEMLFQKGINWNDYFPKYKRGRFIFKETFEKAPDGDMLNSASAIRTRWVSGECPTFTQDKNFLEERVPDL
jgi:tRNA(His) 5'-end guanylyltransferase